MAPYMVLHNEQEMQAWVFTKLDDVNELYSMYCQINLAPYKRRLRRKITMEHLRQENKWSRVQHYQMDSFKLIVHTTSASELFQPPARMNFGKESVKIQNWINSRDNDQKQTTIFDGKVKDLIDDGDDGDSDEFTVNIEFS